MAAAAVLVLHQGRASGQDTIAPLQPITGGEVKCINGKAKIYDCRNVDLLSSLPPPVIGGKAPMVLFGFTEIINDM